ncbi:MAG: hypothetical protein KGL39_11000 [Patescibacteria group bacterium]|nr:hypothetical protein [Patescibacteria group bacterium]
MALAEGRVDLFNALLGSVPWPEIGDNPLAYLSSIEEFKRYRLSLSEFFGVATQHNNVRMMARFRPLVSNIEILDYLADAASRGHSRATKAILEWTDRGDDDHVFMSVCEEASLYAAENGHLGVVKLLNDEGALNAESAYYGIFNNRKSKTSEAKIRAIAHYLFHNSGFVIGSHYIIRYNDPIIVQDFLSVYKGNLEPLCADAAKNGYTSALRVLLQQAYPAREDLTAACMKLAAAGGKTRTMQMLRDDFGAASR